MAEVKCEDCAEYIDFRCSISYHYMNPKLLRNCRRFKARAQIKLNAWQRRAHIEQQHGI